MTSEAEIKKFCYLNARFFIAIKNIVNKFDDKHNEDFTSDIRQCLTAIVGIALKTEQYPKLKSDAYLYDFQQQNPTINLFGNNPFYIINFNRDFEIQIVYIMIEECKLAGILELVLPGKKFAEENIVCAYDLFDDSKEESFSEIKSCKK